LCNCYRLRQTFTCQQKTSPRRAKLQNPEAADDLTQQWLSQLRGGGRLAVPGVVQTGPLEGIKPWQCRQPTPPAHATILQHSLRPRPQLAFLWDTSAHPLGICASDRALPSCLLPPEKERSFPRLSLLWEINGQRGTDAVLVGWLGY